MKVPEPEEEQPIAWQAILADTPVYASGGEEVGTVDEVLGASDADIFHGIVVRAPAAGHDVEIIADQITRITNRRIDIALTVQDIRLLPVYTEEASYTLGFVGLFRKHLGWTSDKRGG